jgi:hypothetical protein
MVIAMSLELSKELRIDRNILDLPHAAVHTELVLLQRSQS